MTKTKRRAQRNGPMIQFGAAKDTVAVLKVLDAALQQALLMGRDTAAVELSREIGKLGGVNGVTISNSTFSG